MNALAVMDPPVDHAATFGRKLGGWWHRPEDGERIVCDLCPRKCSLKEGDRGFCFVRQNVGGQMVLTTYGLSTGFCVDPIEKKPLAHFYPGSSVLSFGTAGCNLGCKFCQNWSISKSREVADLSERAGPEAIAEAAVRLGCKSVAFTYNDPVIWAEYAIDCARACHERGIKTVAVTAGYITPEARPAFYREMDAANVDLKGYTEHFYQHLCLGHLEPVRDTLKWLKHESPVWFEITNLVIPEENDSPEETRKMCEWILENLGDEVPLHFTAFHPDFRLQNRPRTPPETLARAQDQALAIGLKYVYVGNVFDRKRQSTYCPSCGTCVIERDWHELGAYRLEGNRCASCGQGIAGHFDSSPGEWGRRRMPVRILDRGLEAGGQRAETMTAGCGVATACQQAPSGAAMAESGTAGGMLETTSRDSGFASRESGARAAAAATRRGLQSLTQEQRTGILRAAASLVEAALAGGLEGMLAGAPGAGEGGQWSDPRAALSGVVSDTPVYGIFVSLKNQGQLRACCGSFGQTARLCDALKIAAHRSATSDRRFTPLEYSELESLEIEVWLLHSPRRIEARGQDRAQEVTVGQHGLVIGQGPARGLLLPGVAVEAGMDSLAFLEAVCRKAQLPAGAWLHDDTELSTFEGVVLQGHVRPYLPESWAPLEHPRYVGLLAFVREIWKARLLGAAPPLYWPKAADGDVAGVVLSTHHGASHPLATAGTGSAARRRWSRLAPSGGLPLQTTVHQLAQEAIEEFAELGVRRAPDLAGLELRIVLLSQGLPHSLLASPDGPRFDPRREALFLEQGPQRALVLPPQQNRRAMFEQACRAAQVSPAAPGLTAWTLQCIKLEEKGPRGRGAEGQGGAAPETTMFARTVPRPVGSRLGTRPPAKAGMFYPADPEQLRMLVQSLLAMSEAETAERDSLAGGNGAGIALAASRSPERWPAVLVPHAGLRYSGAVAAKTLRRVEFSSTAIVIGPKHTPKGVAWAIDPHERWSIPGATLQTDCGLAEALADSIPDLVFDRAAHEDEHAIEVELPFLHALAPQTQVVGIALGYASFDDCQLFAERLAALLRDRSPRPLLVISSDMNHFAPETENRRRDRLAIDAMLRLDPAGLYETVRAHQISMCGVIPAVIVLETLRRLGELARAELVGYSTSAAVTGDARSVVGYCGMLFG